MAQTTISGTITDGETQTVLPDVNIIVVGTSQGTVSDLNGKYTLTVSQTLPFTIRFTYLGYKTKDIIVNDSNRTIDVVMEQGSLFGQEVVISASRLEQRILKSPVSVEKMNIQYIQQAASADFYDAIANLKGVQITNSALNLTSVNTRGFADATNSRFVQIVDGMDTADPTINANLGSMLGLGELDIESLELLPGAASALYGPNAFNGVLIMKSKSPFDYQGLSMMSKVGFTNSDAGGSNPMGTFSLRYATALNDKFAFKINYYYLGAQDWMANDYTTDRNNPESALDLSNDPNFDGLNLYGDEYALPVNSFGIGTIRRTGIKEETLLDNNDARTQKADIAVHYKIEEDLELIGAYRYTTGRSVGQSLSRLAYRDFSTQFAKLELKSDDFFVRSYMSLSDVDKTYDIGTLGALVNEQFNPTLRPDGSGWIEDYVLASLGAIPGVTPNNPLAARTYADRFMIDPLTGKYVPSFQSVVSELRSLNNQGNPPGAATFVDSNVWNTEFYYNFKTIDWAKVIVGANYRQFNLFSNATTFDEAPVDPNNPERILTNNYGVYTQISKTFAEKLEVSGSIRFDKMKDFDGHFTPRVSAVYSSNKNNNLRVSYQTGFRFPDMISQFIYLPIPDGIVLGGTPSIASRYNVYNGGSWTLPSYINFATQGGTIDPTTGAITSNPGNVTLETLDAPYIKPEQLSSFEIGYNSIIGGDLLIDLNYYHTSYTDFLGTANAISKVATEHQGQQINAGTFWLIAANSPSKIKSNGFGLGLTYNLPNNFVLTGNYTHTTFSGKQPEGFLTQFNTPKNRYNFGIENSKVTKYLGFNINFSYQDAFLWESQFGTGTMASYGLVNAQVNYTIPSLKTVVKLGGTNIGGSDYRTNFGSSFIGQTYYVSLVFDDLLK